MRARLLSIALLVACGEPPPKPSPPAQPPPLDAGRTTTANRPFFVVDTREWRAAGELHPEDRLFSLQGGVPLGLRSIDARQQSTTVYNLSTDPPNTYFAGGALVHNY